MSPIESRLPNDDVMHVPRQRDARQKAALCFSAVLTLGVGIAAFLVIEGTPRSMAPLPFYLDEQSPERTGIVFEHTKGQFAPFFDNVLPFMQAVSASACTTDFDRDGFLDIYFVNSGPNSKNALFRNRGGFTFEHVSSPTIEKLNQDGFSSDCVWADIDNDGYDDLFVGTVGQMPRIFLNQRADETSPHERVFIDVTSTAGGPDYMNGFAVAFLDVERDGDLDLIQANYFPTNYQEADVPGAPRMHPTRLPHAEGQGRMMPNNWGGATNGGRKRLFLNDGQGHFTEQDASSWGFAETRFTFDIGTADINADGWTDLFFANDFGPDQLYFNRAGQGFELYRGTFPTDMGRDSFKGMNADLADIDGDGYPEIYVTNVFHPVLPEGNLLWSNRPHPSGDPFLRDFKNVAAELGVKNGLWGWGAKFLDLDLDSDVDLIATNGYISQDPDKDYWYRMSRLVAGRGTLIADSTHWPPFDDYSMSGHQTSRVFVREGARFYERAEDVGVHRSFDGRGVLVADFDVDGRPDVLFVPQGAPYLLTRNRFVPTDRTPEAPAFFGLQLEGDGVQVARKPVGTRVRISPAEPEAPHAFSSQWFEISAGNSMSAQSMDWILAGLGAYAGHVDVDIHWLDGTRETLRGLAANRYHQHKRKLRVGHNTQAPGARHP